MKNFDKVFWINSINRADRYRNMVQRFSELGYKKTGHNFGENNHIERFEAVLGGHLMQANYKYHLDKPMTQIDGKHSTRLRQLNNGEIGCFQSHVEIYKKIKENGWNKTLILEDDAFISPAFENEFDNIYKDVPKDWQMLYLGQWNYDALLNNTKGETFALKQQIKERVWRAERCWLTHAYAVDISCVDYLIENTQVMYCSIDNVLADIQKKLKVYAIHPNIVNQDLTKSSLR
jgi:glycosyl transferase family 25